MENKSNKITHTIHLDESVEYILNNKSGWTEFTNWAREKYDINNKQANTLWKEAWEVLHKDFSDNIQHTVEKTLLELEQIKTAAKEAQDRKTWLEILKYQNKIQGGEIEKHEIEHKGSIKIQTNWGPRL
jgi:hypothetical protein